MRTIEMLVLMVRGLKTIVQLIRKKLELLLLLI